MPKWRTPSSDILPTPSPQPPREVYNGESLANFISINGIPCSFVNASHGPQISIYRFNFKLPATGNMMKTFDKGMKLLPNICRFVGIKLNCVVEQINAGENAHLAISIPHSTRQIVPFIHALCGDVDKLKEKPYNAALGKTLLAIL
jgi:hypothetical protein